MLDDKKIPSTLLIREFPPELAAKCLSRSGETVLTRAVLSCLFDFFEVEKEFRIADLERKDLQSDLDRCLDYFKVEDVVRKKRSELVQFLSDPNRFHLHGD